MRPFEVAGGRLRGWLRRRPRVQIAGAAGYGGRLKGQAAGRGLFGRGRTHELDEVVLDIALRDGELEYNLAGVVKDAGDMLDGLGGGGGISCLSLIHI